jgi:hypothetical protein
MNNPNLEEFLAGAMGWPKPLIRTVSAIASSAPCRSATPGSPAIVSDNRSNRAVVQGHRDTGAAAQRASAPDSAHAQKPQARAIGTAGDERRYYGVERGRRSARVDATRWRGDLGLRDDRS